MKRKNHWIFFRYAVDFLVDEHDFKLVSVPDLLHPNILRGCGMDVDGERTQVCFNPFCPAVLSLFLYVLALVELDQNVAIVHSVPKEILFQGF